MCYRRQHLSAGSKYLVSSSSFFFLKYFLEEPLTQGFTLQGLKWLAAGRANCRHGFIHKVLEVSGEWRRETWAQAESKKGRDYLLIASYVYKENCRVPDSISLFRAHLGRLSHIQHNYKNHSWTSALHEFNVRPWQLLQLHQEMSYCAT